MCYAHGDNGSNCGAPACGGSDEAVTLRCGDCGFDLDDDDTCSFCAMTDLERAGWMEARRLDFERRLALVAGGVS